MKSWIECELGDAVTLKRGYDLPSQSRIPGPFPIISSGGVSGYHDTYIVEPPAVVTGRYGSIGAVYYSEIPCWPLNTTLYVEDFKGNEPRFIYYLLKTIKWDSLATASAVPGINRNHAHRYPIILPSLEIQRIIVRILSAFDDAIALNSKINDYLAA